MGRDRDDGRVMGRGGADGRVIGRGRDDGRVIASGGLMGGSLVVVVWCGMCCEVVCCEVVCFFLSPAGRA